VSTDATGAISQWNIIRGTTSAASGLTTIFGTSNDPNAVKATGDLATVYSTAGGELYAGYNHNNPETWLAAITSVPNQAPGCS
jgi:hypothetical protein